MFLELLKKQGHECHACSGAVYRTCGLWECVAHGCAFAGENVDRSCFCVCGCLVVVLRWVVTVLT